MDVVEEVKSRLSIEDVIGEYVELKRAGRNFKALSPFSNEKTPSFMVSPEKQIWHDFSSGKGGNMFGFIMEVEGLDFKGALQLLARKAGVDLEQYSTRPAGDGKLKERLIKAHQLAVKFYQAQLKANPVALNYLIKERQFSKETILNWKFGYSPNTGRALTTYLTKNGFTTDEMKRAGLAVERHRGLGDMFRGRIMIPLADQQGAVVGFTARLLSDEPEQPKYINTPATLIYDKSRQVFGLHLAKEQVRKSAYVVVVEGNMDVVSAHQAGTSNVVATAGTAMTEQHLKTLKRFTSDIRLCFDADQAGLNATERVIPMAQKLDLKLSIIGLEGAKDPDELIHKDVHLWQDALDKKTYALDWLVNQYAAQLDIKSAEGKRIFTDTILAVIRRLSDPVEKDHYVQVIAKLTGASISAVSAKLNQKPHQPTHIKRQIKILPDNGEQDREHKRLEDHFLCMTLMQPKLRYLLRDCKNEFFVQEPAKKVMEFLKANPDFAGAQKEARALRSIIDYVKIISLQFEELYQDLEYNDLLEQATRLKIRLIASYVAKEKRELLNKINALPESKSADSLMKKVNELNKLLANN